MSGTKHAVLSGDQLWMHDKAEGWLRADILSPHSLTDLADIALSRYISHVWILPGVELARQESHGVYSIQLNERHHKLAAASIWKRGGGHVNLIFADNSTFWGTEAEPRWMQRAARNPPEIIVTIALLEKALGIPFNASAGGNGWAYLKKLHPAWVEDVPGVDLSQLFTARMAPDIIWQSPELVELIVASMKQEMYVHKFDKGAAYPAAAAQTDIGVGTPVHVPHGLHTERLDKIGNFRAVGVWRCSVTSTLRVDLSLPPALLKDGEYWLAGPRINMLRAAGYVVKAFEGYVFEQQHDVLALWANNLWDIRQSFDNHNEKHWNQALCMGYAREAIKLIANATIGFTAFHGFEEGNEEKRRPDIRVQVIARHTEIMRANLAKVKAVSGAAPILVYMDAAYYLSDNPDGRTAFPELVKREGKLGGFRYEGRVLITHDVRDMLLQKKNVAARLEYLNAKGWVQ